MRAMADPLVQLGRFLPVLVREALVAVTMLIRSWHRANFMSGAELRITLRRHEMMNSKSGGFQVTDSMRASITLRNHRRQNNDPRVARDGIARTTGESFGRFDNLHPRHSRKLMCTRAVEISLGHEAHASQPSALSSFAASAVTAPSVNQLLPLGSAERSRHRCPRSLGSKQRFSQRSRGGDRLGHRLPAS